MVEATKADGDLWGEARPVRVIHAPDESPPPPAPGPNTMAEMEAGRRALAAQSAGLRALAKLQEPEPLPEPVLELEEPAVVTSDPGHTHPFTSDAPLPKRRGRSPKVSTPADVRTFAKDFLTP
jgi:hypothetical protein